MKFFLYLLVVVVFFELSPCYEKSNIFGTPIYFMLNDNFNAKKFDDFYKEKRLNKNCSCVISKLFKDKFASDTVWIGGVHFKAFRLRVFRFGKNFIKEMEALIKAFCQKEGMSFINSLSLKRLKNSSLY